MSSSFDWAQQFALDIEFGYVHASSDRPGQYNPKLVVNQDGRTVEHAIVEELERCREFTFSVAFVSAGAVAQLKQHLRDFQGSGRIVTSDFLGFNPPHAFAELLNLSAHTGIDVRRHTGAGFHPKGYIFGDERSMTAMIGSSNLTSSALSHNHEWNLKVSAAAGSDLAGQLNSLLDEQVASSEPLTEEWIDEYARNYVALPRRARPQEGSLERPAVELIRPNRMQQDALLALDLVRAEGAARAVVISATGTGKTMLSALDVRMFNPGRLLFVVHREQILDRTIDEYRRVLGGALSDYGKLTGAQRQHDRKYVFATIQTLSQDRTLTALRPDEFDYVIIDEAHRAGAATYRRVIDCLRPKFLLGMTATPERTDGFNVFELFHYNVPYEIRLNHALDAEMLCPFHYYGIADIVYDDGATTSEETELGLLISPERVRHLVKAIELYGQAGVAPRGLIFCSRKEEARALSEALNRETLRGQRLRTVDLTGDDPVALREERVAELELGELDYILTVDIFNEGIDIPTINQVIMLRQTQSPIVFVQQLGRGLRLHDGKDYLVVIDFIGNYANNFMIPIALFGNESLNRETLRERLNETVEAGALPGLSSVSFDEISRDRILSSIARTNLDSMTNLKLALIAMQNRVGGVPRLEDFYRFESVDPMLLATKRKHYPALVASLLRVDTELSSFESSVLELLSHEVLPAKRLHEVLLLKRLLRSDAATVQEIEGIFQANGISVEGFTVRSAIDTLALRGYTKSDAKRYGKGMVETAGDVVSLTSEFQTAYRDSTRFASAVDDLLATGKALTRDRYLADALFTPGMQYSRRDAARLLGWNRSVTSTIYGYKADPNSGSCPIFVTLHKADSSASTAYEDRLLDPSTMRWFSKNKRTLQSPDVRAILGGRMDLYVFVKKDDAEGSDHYFLGVATAHDGVETSMPSEGATLPVVAMTLRFEQPIKQGLFDYFHPVGTQRALGE